MRIRIATWKIMAAGDHSAKYSEHNKKQKKEHRVRTNIVFSLTWSEAMQIHRKKKNQCFTYEKTPTGLVWDTNTGAARLATSRPYEH